MAIPTIKATYSLDVETVRALEEMARRQGVSKSEALRRAIRAAASISSRKGNESLRQWDQLQRSFGLDSAKARAWAKEVRTERKASSARREGRSG